MSTEIVELDKYLLLGQTLVRLYLRHDGNMVFDYNGKIHYYNPDLDGPVVTEKDRPELFI